jgi:chromosome segregation ATPase
MDLWKQLSTIKASVSENLKEIVQEFKELGNEEGEESTSPQGAGWGDLDSDVLPADSRPPETQTDLLSMKVELEETQRVSSKLASDFQTLLQGQEEVIAELRHQLELKEQECIAKDSLLEHLDQLKKKLEHKDVQLEEVRAMASDREQRLETRIENLGREFEDFKSLNDPTEKESLKKRIAELETALSIQVETSPSKREKKLQKQINELKKKLSAQEQLAAASVGEYEKEQVEELLVLKSQHSDKEELLEKQIEELHRELRRLEDRNSVLIEHSGELEREFKLEMEQKDKEHQKIISEVRRDYEEKIFSLQAKLSEFEGKGNQVSLDDLHIQLSSLQTQLSKKDDELSVLSKEAEIKSECFASQIHELTQERENLKAQLEIKDRALLETRELVEAKQSFNAEDLGRKALDPIIQVLEKSESCSFDRSTSLSVLQTSISEFLEAFITDAYQYQELSDSLSNKLNELEKNHSSALEHIKKTETQYSSLLEQLKKVQSDSRDSIQREQMLNGQIESINAQLQKSKTLIKSLASENEGLKAQTRVLNDQLQEV